jgi:hypothetical protein
MDLVEIEWKSQDWTYLERMVVRSCEHGNEHSGSIRGVEFIDQLRNR